MSFCSPTRVRLASPTRAPEVRLPETRGPYPRAGVVVAPAAQVRSPTAQVRSPSRMCYHHGASPVRLVKGAFKAASPERYALGELGRAYAAQPAAEAHHMRAALEHAQAAQAQAQVAAAQAQAAQARVQMLQRLAQQGAPHHPAPAGAAVQGLTRPAREVFGLRSGAAVSGQFLPGALAPVYTGGMRLAGGEKSEADMVREMAAAGVKAYTAEWCGFCKKLKALGNGIETLIQVAGNDTKTSDGNSVNGFPTIDYGKGKVSAGYKDIKGLYADFKKFQSQ